MPTSVEAPLPCPRPVLLYDGECGLCGALVSWLRRRRGGNRIGYMALQAPDAQAYLAQHGLPTRDFDSLVLVPDWDGPRSDRYLLRTDGLCAALIAIGGPLRALGGLRLVPRPLRDWAYALVARSRHRLTRRRSGN